MNGASVAQQVRDYIEQRPVVREALRQGIVNYSALARQIMDELGIDKEDAVLAACRRHWPAEDGSEDAIHAALVDARLELRTGMGMLSYEPSWQLLETITKRMKAIVSEEERIHILHGWEALTIVAAESVLDDMATALGRTEPLDRRSGLAEINVKTEGPMVDVPGLIAHVATALAARDVAVVDATTCRSDHIFLIRESDVPAAVDAVMLPTAGLAPRG